MQKAAIYKIIRLPYLSKK